MKILYLITLLSILMTNLFATNYYVAQNDPNASDSNPGTEALPFETIQAAADEANDGDTVFVKSGTYRETVIPVNSGSSGSPIVFMPYQNDNVTVTGTEEITGWTNAGISGKPNIYKAPMATNFMSYEHGYSDQVFVDREMMINARWPNTSLNVTYPKKMFTTAASRSGSGPYTGTLTSETAPPDIDYPGAHIYYQPDTGEWTWAFSGRIQSVSGNQVVFETVNAQVEDGGTDYADIGRYYLFDALELLDQAGEWYHDQTNGELYIWTPNSDDLTDPGTSVKVEARKREFAFDLSEKSYIEVRGFNLHAATVTTDRLAGIDRGVFDADGFNTAEHHWRGKGSVATASHITIDGLSIKYPFHSMNMEYSFHLQYGYSSGVVLGGYDHVLQNCHIQFSSANGISCAGFRHKIHNNLIEDVAYNGRGYAGIAFGAYDNAESMDHEISYNTIRRCGRSGLILRNIKNSDPNNLVTRIHHNDISEFMLQDNDGGAMYAGRNNLNFTRIDHNYIHDGNQGYMISGIYFDFCKNAIIDHNIVDDIWVDLALTQTWYNDNNEVTGDNNMIIYNNTFICNNHPTDQYISGPFNFSGRNNSGPHSPYKAGLIVKNNIAVVHTPPAKGNYRSFQFYDDYAELGDVSNNYHDYLESTVYFEDYSGDDYRLTSASTDLIDAGVVIQSHTLDGVTVPAFNDPVSGTNPDIGAYEYGQQKWAVGANLETDTAVLTLVKPKALNGQKAVIYPNPVYGKNINLKLSGYQKGEEIIISVFGLLGELLSQSKTVIESKEATIINLSNVQFKIEETGIFIIQIDSKNGQQIKKLIVQ